MYTSNSDTHFNKMYKHSKVRIIFKKNVLKRARAHAHTHTQNKITHGFISLTVTVTRTLYAQVMALFDPVPSENIREW